MRQDTEELRGWPGAALTFMLDFRRICERLRTFRANRESSDRLHEAAAGFGARRRTPLPQLAVQPAR
jgi:hypothetical protein